MPLPVPIPSSSQDTLLLRRMHWQAALALYYGAGFQQLGEELPPSDTGLGERGQWKSCHGCPAPCCDCSGMGLQQPAKPWHVPGSLQVCLRAVDCCCAAQWRRVGDGWRLHALPAATLCYDKHWICSLEPKPHVNTAKGWLKELWPGPAMRCVHGAPLR
jgi:hypothetical protein